MENQYCIFYKNDKLQFGWIKEVRKNKLVVLPEQGKEFVCAQSRLEYVWEGEPQSNDKDALSYLAVQSIETIKNSAKIEIEIIHELSDPEKGYTIDELANDFLEDSSDNWLKVSLLISLKNGTKYFQQKKDQYYKRSEEEIQKFEEIELKKRENEKRQQKELEWAEELVLKKRPEIADEDRQHWIQFLNRIVNFLIYWDKSQEKTYFCTLFRCSLNDAIASERKLLDVLSGTENRLSWGSLLLRRASIDQGFEEKELIAADRVREQDIWKNRFDIETKDQTTLKTYTVDNEETKDFDDALSWELNRDGIVIRVHISDVASFIAKSDLLFEKAEQRMSTLYTLKSIYPMFHTDLSESTFSLIAGKDRPVMTFEVQLDHEGKISQSEIYRSVVQVDNNMTYEAVDGLISDNQSPWGGLWQACQMLQQNRIENGSLELERLEVKLDISNPDRIVIKETRQNTPATMVVQELAILANYVGARYCQENGIACLFRTQPPYSISKQLAEGEKPTLKDINIQPAKICLEPDTHSALGLDCYIQVTSPIRRFLDLVNQSIIFARLSGQSSEFSQEELLIWAKRGEETQREYNLVERKLTDHWKIKYLHQHQNEIFETQLIRYFRNRKAQVNIVLLQLLIDCYLEGPEEGEIFYTRIDSVDPKTNQVSLSIHQDPE